MPLLLIFTPSLVPSVILLSYLVFLIVLTLPIRFSWFLYLILHSCRCSRSSQVDFNFVLAGSLRGAQKKSTVGRLLRGAKDDGEGG